MALSTQEGVEVFRQAQPPFDAVVTDAVRLEAGSIRPDAGIALISALRQLDAKVPIFVYASPSAVRSAGEQARAAGAAVVTPSPTELLSALEHAGATVAAANYIHNGAARSALGACRSLALTSMWTLGVYGCLKLVAAEASMNSPTSASLSNGGCGGVCWLGALGPEFGVPGQLPYDVGKAMWRVGGQASRPSSSLTAALTLAVGNPVASAAVRLRFCRG